VLSTDFETDKRMKKDLVTRDELRYILDPKEVHGEDPSTGSGQVSLARRSAC
jgi:hypothetical protein